MNELLWEYFSQSSPWWAALGAIFLGDSFQVSSWARGTSITSGLGLGGQLVLGGVVARDSKQTLCVKSQSLGIQEAAMNIC